MALPSAQQPKLYHLARLWVELTRQLHQALAPDMQGKFGSRASLLLIGLAVYLGTVEGRPMSATKLAAYLGMPRPTVIRRLRTLTRRGAIEKAGNIYRTPAKRLERMTRQDYAALARLVRTTTDRLFRAPSPPR